jgi:putative YhdH/YhfP family quinone oxidoreductase
VERDGGFSEYVRVPAANLLRVPAQLSLLDAAALGVAGFTAALAVHLLEQAGLRCGQGPVLVTGASGGVGSMAIDMLSMLGHEVVAMSGKAQHQDKLLALGAAQWLDGREAPRLNRPLESGRWAGAVDTVGGAYLSWIIATLRERGAVAALGNAAGNDFSTSVLPFILRSVQLIGVNASAWRCIEQDLWQRLATGLRPQRALQLVQPIRFEQIPDYLGRLREREIIGRVVARFE